MTCPHCGESSRCKGFRSRPLLTLLGPVRYERHYYHCSSCARGTSPLDKVHGLCEHDLTPAADEVVCLSGLEDSFAVGAETLLTRMAGLRVCESTVQRATEAAGARLAEIQHTGQPVGRASRWQWHKDAEGRTVGYISVDATGIGQQGPNGAKAEGRMVTIGMVYNPIPKQRERWADPHGRRPKWQARYVAQLRPLAELSQPLRCQAGMVGLDFAERWIALSDGGSGLEDFLRTNFPRVEAIIVDFYHAAEYLGKLSKVLYPGQVAAADVWRSNECHRLKTLGGQAVLQDLLALNWEGKSAMALEVRNEVIGYFQNQVHRMDYPAYMAKGWQIGSGPVESACKTVIGERMKGGGMRWGECGGDGMSHLRAIFCSEQGQWEAFWSN
jgi:hypothetical protein